MTRIKLNRESILILFGSLMGAGITRIFDLLVDNFISLLHWILSLISLVIIFLLIRWVLGRAYFYNKKENKEKPLRMKQNLDALKNYLISQRLTFLLLGLVAGFLFGIDESKVALTIMYVLVIGIFILSLWFLWKSKK